MNLGNWQLDTVDGGALSLDGGVVYGIVPKVLWEKLTPPDAHNRLKLRNSCLLARDGSHTVLIDTGYGGKHDRLDRLFYELEEGEPLLRSLAALDVSPEQVDTVVFSHLHFDHAGGASRYDDRRKLSLTFPRARHVVGQIEWEDATGKLPELERAYPEQNITALAAAGRLEFISGNATIVPGLRSLHTGGHTRGHLALVIESAGESAIWVGDVCPTVHHLRRSWCLAYDTHVVKTRRVKPKLLGDAAARNSWVLLTHDPMVAAARLAPHPQREFDVVESLPRL